MSGQTKTTESAVDGQGGEEYHKALDPRHLQMIALGGSIGTGLFLGAGGRLSSVGPGLALVYITCGLFTFMVVRALAELVMYRPSSGAFVDYAREFLGEAGAYTVGWLYFVNWSTTVIADITAVALYFHFWQAFALVPQWMLALIALGVVISLNMLSVRVFGELEFWFALVKIVTILVFLGIGLAFLALRIPVAGHTPGFGTITENGGLMPHGTGPLFAITLGVVFAFGGMEMIGVAAGESKDPRAVVPRAVNSIMWRIVVFYAGSIVMFALLLPWSAYSAGQSPFVTVMSAMGLPHAGDAMNLVVLTAALSSLNAGLYATGRTLRSMAMSGTAPAFARRMNRHGVPYGGILITASIGVVGVLLNLVVPAKAFEIVLNLAGLGVVGTWGSIMICHWLFVRRCERGDLTRPAFRLPGTPYVNVATLLFLGFVVALMATDVEVGRVTLLLFAAVLIALAAGWPRVRERVAELAALEARRLRKAENRRRKAERRAAERRAAERRAAERRDTERRAAERRPAVDRRPTDNRATPADDAGSPPRPPRPERRPGERAPSDRPAPERPRPERPRPERPRPERPRPERPGAPAVHPRTDSARTRREREVGR